MTAVTAGSMFANIASYGLHLVAGRWLLPSGYSEFAVLLNFQLVLAVPAIGLQAVVARERVHGAGTRQLRTVASRCALAVMIVGVFATPLAVAQWNTGLLPTAAAVLTAPFLVLLSAELGRLQGDGKFGRLAAVLAVTGFAKVIPAVIVMFLGGGATGALLSSAVGISLVALRVRYERDLGIPSAATLGLGWVAVLRASQVQFVLVVMTSIDLLLARNILGNNDSGLYSFGAIATKAAFWLPAAVGVVFYPKMATPDQSANAVRRTLLVLTVLGIVTAALATALSPVIPWVVGPEYQSVTWLFGLFAFHGAVLSVLQGALLSAIAQNRTYLAGFAWAGLLIEASVLAFCARSIVQVLVISVICAVVTTTLVSSLVLTKVKNT
ncbi:MAG: polysaccharide biosynthesis protein [Mycobacteriaceae bacterium]